MEVFHEFGNDLALSITGDLRSVNGVQLANQRIIRRLLTNPGDYIWHPKYGAGLPRFIGQLTTDEILSNIQALITEQMFLEDSVSQTPLPVIVLEVAGYGRLDGTITYTHKLTNSQAVIIFSLSESGIQFSAS